MSKVQAVLNVHEDSDQFGQLSKAYIHKVPRSICDDNAFDEEWEYISLVNISTFP